MVDDNKFTYGIDYDSASSYALGTSTKTYEFFDPIICNMTVFSVEFGGVNGSIEFHCDQEPDHLGECTFVFELGDSKILIERDNSEIPDDEELEELEDLLDEMDGDEN